MRQFKQLKQSILFGVVFVLLAASFVLLPEAADAQCAVCKSNVESSLNNGEKATGLGLNDGILLLMAMPYVLMGALFFFWYRARKKHKPDASSS